MASKYGHLIHGVRKLKAGEAYIAYKGTDFTCEPESFRGVVYALASEKGGGWKGTASVVWQLRDLHVLQGNRLHAP